MEDDNVISKLNVHMCTARCRYCEISQMRMLNSVVCGGETTYPMGISAVVLSAKKYRCGCVGSKVIKLRNLRESANKK